MAQDSRRQQGLMMRRRKQEKEKTSAGRVSRQHLASLPPLQEATRVLSPSGKPGQQLRPQSGFGLPGRCTHWTSSPPLAGQAPSAVVAATKAREVKAPRGDGHSLSTQDAANSSRGGGSHSGVLGEGAEDGSGQGHHHGRWFNNHPGVLALPDAGLVAAVGKRGWATGTAQVVAGHGCGLEVHPQQTVVGASEPSEVALAEPPAAAPLPAEVTGRLEAAVEKLAPQVIARPEPRCAPKYSYTYSSQWTHPCNSYRSGKRWTY